MEGKSQLSTWESLASWLEREAGISESKQRWMLEEKDWRRPDSVRSGVRKIGDHSVPGLFAGTTGENSSRANNVAVKCPVHKSTNHKLQECKVFERMSTNEMEQVVDKHRLCLSCLSPGHRLNKCRNKHRCTVEGCDMRHHTLVDDVDLKFIERRRGKQEPQRMVDSARSSVNTLQHSQQSEATSNQVEELCQQCSHSVSLGLETRGRALETLPVVVFGDKGERQVMALRDSGCNTTLMDENLAAALGLSGKEVDLEIKGVNLQKTFTSQHINKCSVARVGRKKVKYLLRDVKTVPSLNGPNQRLKWSTIKLGYNHLKDLELRVTDSSPVQLIIGTNNSDLILPKRIVKPSEHWCYDKVPYAVETPLGWASSITLTVRLKRMKDVQVKMKSYSGWSWLSQG